MRLLVCGGRDYDDSVFLYQALDKFHSMRTVSTLIHGKSRGADQLSENWAKSRGVKCIFFRADWKKHEVPDRKNPAGAIRNLEMITEGHPDAIIAFPGGPGTRNMIATAKKAGIPVLDAVDFMRDAENFE
jgi:UDP-N-acetylmuramoylalanine-D-glutamate ligase